MIFIIIAFYIFKIIKCVAGFIITFTYKLTDFIFRAADCISLQHIIVLQKTFLIVPYKTASITYCFITIFTVICSTSKDIISNINSLDLTV